MHKRSFEMMKKQYAKRLLPSSLLTVDVTLYPYRGKIGFKQYTSSNPAKNMYCFMAVYVWFMCFYVILLFATLTSPDRTLGSPRRTLMMQPSTMQLVLINIWSIWWQLFENTTWFWAAIYLWINILLLLL